MRVQEGLCVLGAWCLVCQDFFLMMGRLVISGEYVCCSVVFVTQVGVSVCGVIWSEWLVTSAISCSLWSSVYEC